MIDKTALKTPEPFGDDQFAQLSRRDMIKHSMGFLVCASGLLIPNTANAAFRLFSPKEKRLICHNRHTGDKLDLVFWDKKGYKGDALAQIDLVMRDHYSSKQVPIDLDLIEGMYQLSQTLNTRNSLEIVSGYRHENTNKNLRKKSKKVARESYHMKGKAVDIRVSGFSAFHLQTAVKKLKLGGVGYYPKANFVHMDTGPIRYW